jgi:hypothetical protein
MEVACNVRIWPPRSRGPAVSLQQANSTHKCRFECPTSCALSSRRAAVQHAVSEVAVAQTWYICLQVAILPLILITWFRLAARTAHLTFLVRTLAAVATPLATLATLLLVVGCLFGMGFHALVGPRLKVWSTAASMTAYMAEQAFVGARRLRAFRSSSVLRRHVAPCSCRRLSSGPAARAALCMPRRTARALLLPALRIASTQVVPLSAGRAPQEC